MIHENLYQLRKKHDITVKGMAITLGVERRTYERWESGARLPDLERLKVILDKFEIKDIYTFIYGDGKKAVIRLARPRTQRMRKNKEKKKIPKLVYKMI